MAKHLRLAELGKCRRLVTSQYGREIARASFAVEAGNEDPPLARRAKRRDERLVPGCRVEAAVRAHERTSSRAVASRSMSARACSSVTQ